MGVSLYRLVVYACGIVDQGTRTVSANLKTSSSFIGSHWPAATSLPSQNEMNINRKLLYSVDKLKVFFLALKKEKCILPLPCSHLIVNLNGAPIEGITVRTKRCPFNELVALGKIKYFPWLLLLLLLLLLPFHKERA